MKTVTCECGDKIRKKPYAPGKVSIPIIVPVNLDGSLHFCYKYPRGNCVKGRLD